MSAPETTVALAWDDPDMLRARADVIGWERNVAERQADIGDAVAALDAIRDLQRRFPGCAPFSKAAIAVEYEVLRPAQEKLKAAKQSLHDAESRWARWSA